MEMLAKKKDGWSQFRTTVKISFFKGKWFASEILIAKYSPRNLSLENLILVLNRGGLWQSKVELQAYLNICLLVLSLRSRRHAVHLESLSIFAKTHQT